MLVSVFFPFDHCNQLLLSCEVSDTHLRVPVSPLSLTPESFPKVRTVLDVTLAESTSLYAIHPSKSDETIFLKGKDIAVYLKSLDAPEQTILIEDFHALKAESLAQPAPSVLKSLQGDTSLISLLYSAAKKPEQKGEKEDARIEGAKLIAIGIKKEVDFAAWYTNVGPTISTYSDMYTSGINPS